MSLPHNCIGTFYRHPLTTVDIFDTFFNVLCSFDSSLFSNLVLLGDFNVNYFDTNSSLYMYVSLHRVTSSFDFSQVVWGPTKEGCSGSSTLVDLVFVSNSALCDDCFVIPTLSSSDHKGVFLSLKWVTGNMDSQPRRNVWRYNHADFAQANELLCELDLDNILDHANIQTTWRRFKSAFLDAVVWGTG